MKKVDSFITNYWDMAIRMEREHGVPALVAMAQSALETGWGEFAPGNMMFGMKAGKNWTGRKQLLLTTEFHKSANIKYPVVVSVTKEGDRYRYRVKDYFRVYQHPYDSFSDYATMLRLNKRYEEAFQYTDPELFAKEIAKAGYATQPQYFERIQSVMEIIKKKLQDRS